MERRQLHSCRPIKDLINASDVTEVSLVENATAAAAIVLQQASWAFTEGSFNKGDTIVIFHHAYNTIIEITLPAPLLRGYVLHTPSSVPPPTSRPELSHPAYCPHNTVHQEIMPQLQRLSSSPFLILNPTLHAQPKKRTAVNPAAPVGCIGVGVLDVGLTTLSDNGEDLTTIVCHIKAGKPEALLRQLRDVLVDTDELKTCVSADPEILYLIEHEKHHQCRDIELITSENFTSFVIATFPSEIHCLASSFLSNYIFFSSGMVGSSTDLISQRVEFVRDMDKSSYLMDLLHAHKLNDKQALTMVFVETKRDANQLESLLFKNGFPVTSIQGEKGVS